MIRLNMRKNRKRNKKYEAEFETDCDEEDSDGYVSKENTKSKKRKTPTYPHEHIVHFIDREFDYSNYIIQVVKDGKTVTAESLRKAGGLDLANPLLVMDDAKSLGMVVPGNDLTIRDIADCIGHAHPVNAMDVSTQEEIPGWTIGDLVGYFECPRRERTLRKLQEDLASGKITYSTASLTSEDGTSLPQVLNQISLEFSNTPLGRNVKSPKFVRDLDWIENVWPRTRKRNNDYPRVQYYCLTSTAGCYTDFHIDFGGTSVWYHVVTGKKVFLLIPPNDHNLEQYESWLCSPMQPEIFFADKADKCYKVTLEEGRTMVIPTGWIHAVYTPIDSIVFGGNFLHSLDIKGQLKIHCLETRTRVPQKFRFPLFVHIMFYAGAHLLTAMKKGDICELEKEGLSTLIDALKQWNVAPGGDADTKGSISETAADAAKLCYCSSAALMITKLQNELNALNQICDNDVNTKFSGQGSLPRKGLKLKLSLKISPKTDMHDQTSQPPIQRGIVKSDHIFRGNTEGCHPTLKLRLGCIKAKAEETDRKFHIFIPQNHAYSVTKKGPKHEQHELETGSGDGEWTPSRKKAMAKKKPKIVCAKKIPAQIDVRPIKVKSATTMSAKCAPKIRKGVKKVQISARDRLKKRLRF